MLINVKFIYLNKCAIKVGFLGNPKICDMVAINQETDQHVVSTDDIGPGEDVIPS